MLKLQKLHKSYGNHNILKIDRLEIPQGVYWIKGMNGIGKSTLLKSIAGIYTFKGDILLNDISIKSKGNAYRALVNFADSEPVFPDFLTGMEMVGLFSKAKAAPSGQADELIEKLKMQHYIESPLGGYSSGMLKKLSLMLAFLGNPKLILLDEPLNTIDDDSLTILYNMISTANVAKQVSFIISSHQQIDITQLPPLLEAKIENLTITF